MLLLIYAPHMMVCLLQLQFRGKSLAIAICHISLQDNLVLVYFTNKFYLILRSLQGIVLMSCNSSSQKLSVIKVMPFDNTCSKLPSKLPSYLIRILWFLDINFSCLKLYFYLWRYHYEAKLTASPWERKYWFLKTGI